MSHDDFERGLIQRRKVLGDAWVDRSLANANTFNAEFQSLITRFAWNDIWGRPGLDHKTRRFLVLATVIALGRWEEFELHFRAAVEGGVPVEELKEVLMQSAIYAGVPAANTAFAHATLLLREMGVSLEPALASAPPIVASGRTASAPTLHYILEGKIDSAAPTVVLSHALGCDVSMWDALAADLAPDYRVLRYDHRGHGQSAVPAGPYSIADLVDDAARLLRECATGPVVWVGLSMGGMVGQGLAIRHPELVRGLVVANSTSAYPEAGRAMWRQRIAAVQAGGLAAIVDAVMQRYFHESFRINCADEVERMRKVVLKTDSAGYIACCEAIAGLDLHGDLSRIRCPALIIAGALDDGTPIAMSQAIVAGIAGAELHVIHEAAHLSAVEQPEVFAAQIRRFLRERVA